MPARVQEPKPYQHTIETVMVVSPAPGAEDATTHLWEEVRARTGQAMTVHPVTLGEADRPAIWVRVSPSSEPDAASASVPFPVLLQLAKMPSGRLACTGLIAGGTGDGAEVTARSLREIPLSFLLGDLAAGDLPVWRALLGEGGIAGTYRPVRAGPSGRTREHFEKVAASYRSALLRNPRAPVKLMAEEMHASEPTVRRWLQRARDMGLLRPAQPGKAGERPVGRRTRRKTT